MNFSLSALLIAALAACSSAVNHGRGKSTAADLTAQFFDNRRYEKLARHQKPKQADAGYQILPEKASPAQCNLALQRITQQPRSCAEQYMARTARNVYLPIYDWFQQPVASAGQFGADTGVSVTVVDSFNNPIAVGLPNGSGSAVTKSDLPIFNSLPFMQARSWALNYPTFIRDEAVEQASIDQVVYSDDGQLVTVIITMPVSVLPVVC